MSTDQESDPTVAARRRFLAACGKFAVVTPPAITLMLAASKQSFAVAVSGASRGGVSQYRRHADNGFGNGGRDGVPGRSRHQDRTR